MACAEPRLTALKVAHKGEIHRLRVDLSEFKFAELAALFAETFSLKPGAFVIQYNDTEGDVLNVTSEPEYIEACRVFLSSADAVKSLRFTAVSRTHVVFQENVTEPILKAIEKLVETLTAAMEKVKQEQWKERAQAGMEHTGEAFNRAARDARESLSAAGRSIQEIPFDQIMKETGEGLKAAADSISSFTNELVEEMRKIQLPVTPATPVHPAEPSIEEAFPVQQADPEWEQVEQQAVAVEMAVPVEETSVAAPIEEAPVVVVPEPEVVEVAPPAVSEEEQKWAEHLAMIRDIFPGVDSRRTIDQLEQCNGNVQVVLNALMEEM